MSTKAVVGSLGLLALGTLASGSFLNINIWKNPFAGMSRSYSDTDSKGTDKEAIKEEKKVEEKVAEVAGEHLAIASQQPEAVEEVSPFVATVEPVQDEVAPTFTEQTKVEVQTVASAPVVEEQRKTPVQAPARKVSAPVTKPVEKPKEYGGGSGQSPRTGNRSNGNGGFCVTPSIAEWVDDVSLCSSSKYKYGW